MKLTVSRIEQIAQGIKVFELRDTAGDTFPAFDSGAHLEVRPSPDLVHRYSLTSDPADLSHYTIAVLHYPAGRGSSLLHEHFKTGDTIEAEASSAAEQLAEE
jgi:vanillate O-demethylase ferredoxin subunit